MRPNHAFPVRINELEFISSLNQIFMMMFGECKYLNSPAIMVDTLLCLN